MSIKPLDMQVLLPKSMQVNKIKQVENQKFQTEQMGLHVRKLDQDKKDMQKVIKKEKAEDIDLQDDEHHNKKEQQEQKKEQRKIRQKPVSRRPNGFYLGHFDAKV